MENLSVLEIQILLRCSQGNFTKSDLSQIYRKYSLTEKQKAIKRLVINDFLIEKILPKTGATKAPVFYFLTEAGECWVKQYKKNYPSS